MIATCKRRVRNERLKRLLDFYSHLGNRPRRRGETMSIAPIAEASSDGRRSDRITPLGPVWPPKKVERMNKATKGALAAAAAGVLLLGGAGSYALWSDSETVDGGTVTAGILDIAPGTSTGWRDISAGAPGTPIPSIASFRMVPGDILQYDATFVVTATGNNLTATLTADPLTAVRYDGTSGLTAVNAPVVVTNSTGSNTITSAQAGQTITVSAKVTFDRETANQVGQNGTINLSTFKLNLQQTRP
ncbi:alternate-type signal peptide domain-containing protein [Rhodococcus sp. 05-2254-5]|nr:alternate-type signal peptide domain-containing protein [Rhodococcus sp. 06-221-2]OZD89664.1 alternate-type signal peptide domain-containing protein [Rhodococcus sp. 05-2256-B4]OZD90079.1 alternate-type signal peptide domain-containing protein [Rhodococcus sp. 05-2256-B3]OZD95439.1 alternate-type signal peptide domain-containing protein [Rhodococcus sp. 05-2256-B2]OZE00084.1 alternate-type signal peptide domain-containing protein [Rhodococcus sp. 05-2256-B1]OZE29441.1 alternate-type signal 